MTESTISTSDSTTESTAPESAPDENAADESAPDESTSGGAAAAARQAEVVTPTMLRNWSLPATGTSKYGKGQVLIIGGARNTPGAAMLAGQAALRVGAGRLVLAVAGSVAAHVAVAVPECATAALDENAHGSVLGTALQGIAPQLSTADVVVVGSGLDDAAETAGLVGALPEALGDETAVVLDAYALGILPQVADRLGALRGRMVLTPNLTELARLAEVDEVSSDELEELVPALAKRYGAVVTCFNVLADPDGRVWLNSAGHGGLGTSGSGDVLAGAIGGLLARGATPAQAACWGTYLHAAAGDRLAALVGPTGFLAGELLARIPGVLVELSV